MRPVLVIACVMSLLAGAAQAWEEPARGSVTRSALMDAIRPHAEWALGAPVEFVVHDLRRSGDVAFANLLAQRPGGAAIDTANTPIVLREEAWEHESVTDIHVLYKKSGETWVAVHFSFGATDVWFSWGPYCRQYRPVIAEFCEGVN